MRKIGTLIRRLSSSRVLVLAASAALLQIPSAEAEELIAVMSSKSAHYHRALEGFSAVMGRAVPVVYLDDPGARVPFNAKVVVAFGSKASLRKYPKGTVLIQCLAPGFEASDDDLGVSVIRVRMLPRPDALSANLRKIQPRLRRLAVLWYSPSFKDYAAALREKFPESSERLFERLASPDELPERLREIAENADAVWLAPDPALVTNRNFTILTDFSAANNVPFYAPTAGLVERGAVASISPSPEQAGAAAAAAAKVALAGVIAVAEIYPDVVEIRVNAAAARAAGLMMNGARP